jgi:lysylphosphatidylglycerol synthetase-like protein (DUF2156 family)
MELTIRFVRVLASPAGILLFFVAAILWLATLPAWAAADDLGIYGAVRPYIAELIGLVVAAIVAYLVQLIRRWTGIEIEARHREALQSALTNAAMVAAERGAAAGAAYVERSVPDALKHFKLDQAGIQRLLEPKLAGLIQPRL